jgi:hypothetical protein
MRLYRISKKFMGRLFQLAQCKGEVPPACLAAWKENCLQSNASAANQSREEKKQTQMARNEVKQLKRELRRKDQALAETAALLVLRKKMHAIWGANGDCV